jgi:hypothetical protein
MNILRRGIPAAEAKSQEPPAEPAMSRRVKVTVERETVTVLVRGQPVKAAVEPQATAVAPVSAELQEPRPPELLPPAPAGEDKQKDCP